MRVKFKSLRHKLVFWFLVFVSSNLIIVLINFAYLDLRGGVDDVFRALEVTHVHLLEDYKNQLNFFTQETKNRVFFEFGTSKYLDQHKRLFEEVRRNLDQLSNNDIARRFGLQEDLEVVLGHVDTYDSLFQELTVLIRERGYKDYNTIGKMRDAAHELEEISVVKREDLLMMRRHEKDFLLRHDNIYLRRLNEQARAVINDIEASRQLSTATKQTFTAGVLNYQRLFREVVDLDRKIGLYDNSGLKKQLDETEEILAADFDALLAKAEVGKARQYAVLQWVSGGVIAAFLLFGVWMSFVISRRITGPLTGLTSYITRFVGSNFTVITDKISVLTQDEIGKLTLNFNVMRDKIIEQLQFFKEKVEERTEELAEANAKLQRVNEANSRFVPTEFLDYLSKKGIEEVQLGDYVERQMTVMFSDIRGFTKFSEGMSPQENFDFINEYLEAVVPCVKANNGFVDKFIGDSVMALFADRIEHAIDCAIDTQAVVRDFNASKKKKGLPAIDVGVGLHTGHLILGTIGELNRMETTVISDAVNTASRMEGLSSIYGTSIVISNEVFEGIYNPKEYAIRFLDNVVVKGRAEPVEVYEVLDGLSDEQCDLRQQCDPDFQQAIALYIRGEIEVAIKLFKRVLEVNPADSASRIYHTRCERILREGVPEVWDPMQRMDVKRID
ncbi:MAG: adenylate/guanylate cyclase domain-containing protein [Bacteroidota bacterium]